MNQPINEQLEELKKRVERLESQQTEPIKVTIERRQTEVEVALDNNTAMMQMLSSRQDEQEELLTKIYTEIGKNNTDIGVLKHEMAGARADIIAIKATQSDHSEILKEHGEILKGHSRRLSHIEATMATKDDVGRLEKITLQILDRLP